MTTSIVKRQTKEKELLLEQLKKMPIIQIACEKVGVGRASFYRWKKEDPEFGEMADQAIIEGNSLINDMAESQLMSAIRDKNMTAIIFWLKSHHPTYANKVEVTGQLTHDYKLTVEEEALIEKALQLAKLVNNEKEISDDNKST